jgi:hypothetical protein
VQNAHVQIGRVFQETFKKHHDTEKHGGMFATLVVQLLSQYRGIEDSSILHM